MSYVLSPIQPEWKTGEWSVCGSGDNSSDSCPAVTVRNVYCQQVYVVHTYRQNRQPLPYGSRLPRPTFIRSDGVYLASDLFQP